MDMFVFCVGLKATSFTILIMTRPTLCLQTARFFVRHATARLNTIGRHGNLFLRH